MPKRISTQNKIWLVLLMAVIIETVWGCFLRVGWPFLAGIIIISILIVVYIMKTVIQPYLEEIEKLNQQINEDQSELETIMELTEVGIGICEIKDVQPDKLVCTGTFLESMGISPKMLEGRYLPQDILAKRMQELRTNGLEENEKSGSWVFSAKKNGAVRWIRMQTIRQEGRTLMLTTDVTREVLEKQQHEEHKEFDQLTKLYNRNMFNQRVGKIFANPEQLGIAAMVLIDLDNLKYVNDTYGHDFGDTYISEAARLLRKYRNKKSVLARLMGDEFLYFVYGFASKEQVRYHLEKVFRKLKAAVLQLPDNQQMSIRISAGVSWYPEDGQDYSRLISYADFAMYKIKRTDKGNFGEFNKETYSRESYLLQCKEELNQIIDQELVRYMFQPIVEARTGEVFAYEALMRPTTEHITTPMELITLARAESKLQKIEKLTMFQSLRTFKKLQPRNKKIKVFVNSISNQRMSEEEIRLFAEENKDYLERIVIEITEDDNDNSGFMIEKNRILRELRLGVAIDDYGDGYSGDKRLLQLEPDYIKIDRSLITNIHKEEKKQILLSNMLLFTRPYGIKVVAEGVEKEEEMAFVIRQGVDYIQGYYTGRPDYQLTEVKSEIKRKIRHYAANIMG